MLYGPEKGVPTDITTAGQFYLPSLGFTAELLAVNCHPLGDPWRPLATLGDPWRYATARPILFNNSLLSHPSLPLPMMQPIRRTVGARLQAAKIIKANSFGFPLYRSSTVASTMTPKHLACICFGGLAVFLANLLCNTFCLDDTLLHLAYEHVVSLGWTVP